MVLTDPGQEYSAACLTGQARKAAAVKKTDQDSREMNTVSIYTATGEGRCAPRLYPVREYGIQKKP